MSDPFQTQGVAKATTVTGRDTVSVRQAPPRQSSGQVTDPSQQADPRPAVVSESERQEGAASRSAERPPRDGPDAQEIQRERKERAERLRERRRKERADHERLDDAREQVREYEASVHELRRRAADVYGTAGRLPSGEHRLVDRLF